MLTQQNHSKILCSTYPYHQVICESMYLTLPAHHRKGTHLGRKETKKEAPDKTNRIWPLISTINVLSMLELVLNFQLWKDQTVKMIYLSCKIPKLLIQNFKRSSMWLSTLAIPVLSILREEGCKTEASMHWECDSKKKKKAKQIDKSIDWDKMSYLTPLFLYFVSCESFSNTISCIVECMLGKNVTLGATAMASWLRALTVLPADLGSTPSMHMVTHNFL